MEPENESNICPAALCKKLGDLWPEDDVVSIMGEIPLEKKRECDLTLYGKLYS